MQRRAATAAVLSLTVLISTACGGIDDPVAGFDTVSYKSTLLALNGTPIGSVTAINTATALTVRAEVGYEFDIAFDIDEQGSPVVLTQRAVGLPQNTGGRSVALQALMTPFESVDEAPRGGWVTDSILTVAVGETFVVRATNAVCQLFASPFLYSKAVVDSLDMASRRLWLSVVSDPNCGFRSFEPGRPDR